MIMIPSRQSYASSDTCVAEAVNCRTWQLANRVILFCSSLSGVVFQGLARQCFGQHEVPLSTVYRQHIGHRPSGHGEGGPIPVSALHLFVPHQASSWLHPGAIIFAIGVDRRMDDRAAFPPRKVALS